jgi:predicted permease
MSAIAHDLRYAIRTLRRSLGLTLVVVASLAIGIGANTAIFSVVNALLLKPLPYPDPDRLVVLWLRSPGIAIPQDWPSPGQYFDIQNENTSFESMSISRGRAGTLLAVTGQPLPQAERVEALETSSSLFPLLGGRPLHGRLLRPDEDKPGQPAVAIISHGFWTRVLGADPHIVGKVVTLNGLGSGTGEQRNQYEVVGVLPRDFLLNAEIMPTVASIRQMDVFLPLPFGADAVNRRGDENFNVMARLKPGVSLEQAKADVLVTAGRIREKDTRDRTFTIDTVSLVESVVGNVRLAVLVLLGSVALVLLIACVNVANLLLTRATGRQKEVAVRTALGAGWQRLVRQLLTESLMLGLLGGVAGLLVAEAALQVVRGINPGNIPRLDAIALDGTVLAFTFAISIVTGLLFGLAPALRAARLDLNTALRAGGRNTQGEGGFGSRRRLRSLLVVSEVAISLMLLVGAGLLIRSFVRLQNVSPGFQPEGVVSMRLGPTARRFADRSAQLEYTREMAAKLAAVPGVTTRGAVSVLPFTTAIGWGSINVEGWVPKPGEELQVDIRNATPDYFKTMQVPLVAGRTFEDADVVNNGTQPVVVIDEKFARRFWPNGDAVGKHVWFDPKTRMQIVGVVGNVKQYGLDVDGRVTTYFPSLGGGWHVARTAGDPRVVGAAMARVIRDADPSVTIVDIETMTARMSQSMARQRFATLMLGAFAAFALLLAVVGVYGVLSHLVTQGAHDIGLRMALGAERSNILRMVMRQGLELTGAGMVLGVLGAYGLTRVMANLLYEVSATDVLTFAIAPVALLLTAMLASGIPALRATRVDPVVALRDE